MGKIHHLSLVASYSWLMGKNPIPSSYPSFNSSNTWKAGAAVPWNTTSKKILPHCIVVHLGAMAIRVDIRERRRRDLECKVMLASVLAENPKEFHRHHRVFINNPNQSCASLASHTVILSDRTLGPLQFCLASGFSREGICPLLSTWISTWTEPKTYFG